MPLFGSLLSWTFGLGDRAAVDQRRALLIGTARSVRQLRHALKEHDQPPHCVGCMLLGSDHHIGGVGLPILGDIDQLDLACRIHRIDTALICLPLAMADAARSIQTRCTKLGVTARLLPTLDDQLAGRVQQSSGAIDVTRLLDREPRKLDESAIDQLLRGKRVMVTGAGGSIGGELSRIIARYQPTELQLMERAENNLFDINRQIREAHPHLTVRAILHDVALADRTLSLCREHQPQVIFHAAAHKHVPMMEDHPAAAVTNNLFGTRAIADAAHAVGCEKFVMISTDKAVNPTSVMGATKRMAEMYIQALNANSPTCFTMVRFGNVLASACSVVPIWTAQLAAGGPITVTDPRMTRYFMTIPEAAALVIQAATVPGNGGQVMLLDMGEPIAIRDMAERFIRLHGLEPERDVAIVYTGVRPGEKLFEELAYDSEDMQPTVHDSVRIWKTTPPDAGHIQAMMAEFEQLRSTEDGQQIHQALRRAVPEMKTLSHTLPPDTPDASLASPPAPLISQSA